MVSPLFPERSVLTAAITPRRVWHFHGASRGVLFPYALVVTTVCGAAVLASMLPLLRDALPGAPFLAAVMVSAWMGGLGPGLAATGLAALGLELLFIRAFDSFEPGYQDLVRVAVFVLVGILITLLNELGRMTGHALDRSQALLQSTLDSLGVPLAIIDRAGVIVARNAAWGQVFRGGASEERGALGTKYLDVWAASGGDDRAALAQGMGEVLGKVRREFLGEFRRWHTGELRWFAVRITAFASEGGGWAAVVHEDITGRKRAEEAERRTETLRSVARLARAAAHEINNPLAIIMGNVEIIAQQIDPAVSDRVRPTLDAIERIRLIVQSLTGIANPEIPVQSPSLPEMLDLHGSSASADARQRDQ